MKAKIFMKSGNVVEFQCRGLEVRRGPSGELVDLEWDWGPAAPMFADLYQIEAVQAVGS